MDVDNIDDYNEDDTVNSSLTGPDAVDREPDQRSHLTKNGAKRPWQLDLLFAIFGISAWLAINGIWVESPVLVQYLPEGWKLASYIVVLTQLANIGPLLYSVLRRWYKSDDFEKWSIHVIMAIGTMSCVLLIFYWDTKTQFWGAERSVPFLGLLGLVAIVDCTSSVLYLPFVAQFQPEYVRPLIVGEGMSGLVPSTFSLIQGVGGNPSCVNQTINGTTTLKPVYAEPRFSTPVFFTLLTLMMIASWLAFAAINYFEFAKAEKLPSEKRLQTAQEGRTNLNSLLSHVEMSKRRFYLLLTTQSFICCLMNGIIASISTYSTLPYGNTTYHLATNLSVISGPVAAFLVFSIHRSKQFQRPIIPLTIIGTSAAIYIIVVAASSPHTPLQGTTTGSALIVFAWFFYHGCFSYVKACIAGTMRNSSFGGHKALYYYGVFTQIGSFVGAFFMFFVVNYTKTFKSFNPCQQ
ncbi:Riboflavin transporter 2 [Halotydeus destructor]|nr:Riboflavin transporter 2 [Halotydeus destructor]